MREQKRQSRARTSRRLGAGGLHAASKQRQTEGARQTLNDLDPEVFESLGGEDKRVTLNLSVPLAKKLASMLGGDGLTGSERGELEVALGEGLQLDEGGRITINAGDSLEPLVDSTGGTVDPDGEITGANANGMATLLSKVNDLLDALSVGVRG